MKDIYNDATYLSHNPTWHEEDAPFKAERILSLLRHHPGPYRTVAEVGCGSGEILVQLARHMPPATQFVGYDISLDALAIAQPKANNQLRFEHLDLTQAPLPEPFDLLLVIDVLEHLTDYFTFLRGIVGKARYTLFHIPLDMSVWSLLREQMLLESKARVGHIHNFTEDFVLSVLAEYGFKVVAKRYTEPVYKHKTRKEHVLHWLREGLYALNPKFCTKTLGGYSLLVLTENQPGTVE